MNVKKFLELEERQFAEEPGGYGECDAKAALLGLKAQGRIEFGINGNVSRKL